jgi:alkylhydroperoxidase family enzyme
MAARVEPVNDADVSPDIRERFEIAEQRGAPNSMLLRILARNPHAVKMFYDSWGQIFYDGILDHGLKEIVRVRMARTRGCGY